MKGPRDFEELQQNIHSQAQKRWVEWKWKRELLAANKIVDQLEAIERIEVDRKRRENALSANAQQISEEERNRAQRRIDDLRETEGILKERLRLHENQERKRMRRFEFTQKDTQYIEHEYRP